MAEAIRELFEAGSLLTTTGVGSGVGSGVGVLVGNVGVGYGDGPIECGRRGHCQAQGMLYIGTIMVTSK